MKCAPMEARAENRLREAALDGIVVWNNARAEVTREQVRHQVAEGRLEVLGRGVWKLAAHPWTRRTTYRAGLALAGADAVLGLRTAAHLHEWYAYRRSEGLEILIARASDHRSTIGRIVQTRSLPPEHICVVDGFPVTTPARTFFDLCGDPEPGVRYRSQAHERAMVRVYNDALRRGGLSFVAEAAVLSIHARRGRQGTALVRRLLARFGPRYVPTASEVETMFFELCRDRALPEPEKQVAIGGPRGFIGVVDFFWREAKHIVEIDSSWHDGPLDEEYDEERDDLLREAGYTVDRYRFGHLVLEPNRVVREVGAAVGVYTPPAAPRT